MVHRIPLIVNASANQIQELPTSDSLAGGVPLGAILMWGGGNTIPTGFTLCNAANAGTVNGITVPNLEDKFIIGAKQHSSGWKTNVTGSLGASGGSKDSTLVSHSHTTNTTIQRAELGNAALDLQGEVKKVSEGFLAEGSTTGIFSGPTNGGNNSVTESASNSDVGNFSIDVRHRHGTDTQGSASTNTNLPPYVALAYIIRTS
tara:strand:+ start:8 stop:616 length:609 start_codon:yes stop_codon:yes gene_type:complete